MPGVQNGHHAASASEVRFEDLLQVVTSGGSSIHDEPELVVHEKTCQVAVMAERTSHLLWGNIKSLVFQSKNHMKLIGKCRYWLVWEDPGDSGKNLI